MDDKTRTLADLRDIFNRWKGLTARLREPELTAPLPGGMSVKDVVAHLHAWQNVSIARLEASRIGREPVYPGWAGLDPDDEAELEAQNARIRDLYRSWPWPEVHRAWRDGFLRFLALAEAVPAAELTDRHQFRWLNGYALIDVLRGSYEHHREHLEELV